MRVILILVFPSPVCPSFIQIFLLCFAFPFFPPLFLVPLLGCVFDAFGFCLGHWAVFSVPSPGGFPQLGIFFAGLSKKPTTSSRRSREFRPHGDSVPAWDPAGRMPVTLWESTLERADALYKTESAVEGVDSA